MIVTLQGHQRNACRSIFQQLFRLRYDTFVRDRQWTLPTRNGTEIDQYDRDDSIYFYGLDEDNFLRSHVRLTPSVTSSLLADCFPHLVETGVDIRSATVFEGTRLIVSPRKGSKISNKAAKAELLVAMFEWSQSMGATHIQVIVESRMLASYVEMTPDIRPLGLAHPYGGGPQVLGGGEALAIRCPVTDKVIKDLRSFGGLVNGIDLRKNNPVLPRAA